MSTLIFDWDGTLHDTLTLYGHAFRCAYEWLVSEGYAPERTYTDSEVSKYLGMSAPDMWASFMPELPDEVWQEGSKRIGDAMVSEVLCGHARLYPGTLDVLDKLKADGHTLVILSNCKERYMEAHRKMFGLDRWFSDYFCAETYGFMPKCRIFEHLQKKWPGPYVVIGDRDSDMEVATVHGLRSVGCSYGFGEASELATAEWRIGKVTELGEISF